MLLLSENSIILHCHNILYLKKIISTSSYVSIDQHIPPILQVFIETLVPP